MDTHTFLWWITDDPKLSLRVRGIISDGENVIFISAVTGWEIAIKAQIGRLKLPDKPQRFILEQLKINGMKSLPIEMRHALHISTLPIHHQDPFDRMLIAQAQMEELPVLSADPEIGKYEVTIIW
ncbi:MAG: type II toxin-antitoxin system VapC family toxin [Thermodesulfobacteriota bacterium]|nr:type II toxin-antitoxin system VapC family toxin [Thermodesulfobacteriota bacterium]